MMPPVYSLLVADTSVTAYLGNRIYPFGEAPQDGTYPYVTWQVITGVPVNTLACRPDIDAITVQVDVWSKVLTDCVDAAEAVRNKLEVSAHLVGFGTTDRSTETRAYRYRMDFQFWTSR